MWLNSQGHQPFPPLPPWENLLVGFDPVPQAPKITPWPHLDYRHFNAPWEGGIWRDHSQSHRVRSLSARVEVWFHEAWADVSVSSPPSKIAGDNIRQRRGNEVCISQSAQEEFKGWALDRPTRDVKFKTQGMQKSNAECFRAPDFFISGRNLWSGLSKTTAVIPSNFSICLHGLWYVVLCSVDWLKDHI